MSRHFGKAAQRLAMFTSGHSSTRVAGLRRAKDQHCRRLPVALQCGRGWPTLEMITRVAMRYSANSVPMQHNRRSLEPQIGAGAR